MIVSTNVANDTIDTAMVVKIASAASGPPVIHDGITSKPNPRSMATVPSDNTMPPSTHITGMNHRAERTPVDEEAIDAPLPLLVGDVEPSQIPHRWSLHRAGVVEAGAVTRAAVPSDDFRGVPADGAAQMSAGEAHGMNCTGLVAAAAEDFTVAAHDATLTGSAPVDSLGPQPAEPVADEVTANLEVVAYEAGDRAVTAHAAWPEPMRMTPASSTKRRSARSEVTTGALGISATRGRPQTRHRARQSDLAMSSRAFLARAAPIAVFTLFCSSGGGSTAGRPSASIHNSRVQPVV